MIKHIVFRGEKYPVKIGYYTIKMLKAETGKEIEDVFAEGVDLVIFETLLFYALKQGCKYTGVPFEWVTGEDGDAPIPFTKDMMEDVLDDCFFEFVELIPAFFPSLLKKAPPTVTKKIRKK